MKEIEDLIVPDIKIIVYDSIADRGVLREVMSGVEEESVPCDILTSKDNDAVSLAYEAAMLSVLEVGIGIDGEGLVAVHTKGLPKDSPLFKVNYRLEKDMPRTVGSNAARLVKGVPFILKQEI